MSSLRLVAQTVVIALAAQGCVRHVIAPPDGKPDPLPDNLPPEMVVVNVVSNDEHQTWEVYAGDDLVCTTPCTKLFDSRAALFLESNDGDALYLPEIGDDALRARRAMVVAEGTWEGKKVNGIVFTTLGGMGLVTAAALAAVGCSDLEERAGMCNAGLITGMVSAPLTAFAIWMIVDSNPRAHVLPMFEVQARNGQPPVRVAVTPAGVVGAF